MSPTSRLKSFRDSRNGRIFVENITAYLFIGPAWFIIFLFGLFPVAFAFFVSLHRWRRFPDEYIGLDNYIAALGDFAYVMFFWLALGLLLVALLGFARLAKRTQAHPIGLAYLLPGTVIAAATVAFVNWFFTLLPIVLDVPRRLRGQGATEGDFLRELVASFGYNEPAAAAVPMALLLIAALGVSVLSWWLIRVPDKGSILLLAALAVLALMSGVLLLDLVLNTIQDAIEAARADGGELPIWSQIILISLGALLLAAAYRLWKYANATYDNRRFIGTTLAVVLLVIGGYLLITELPRVLADADRRMLRSFNVTVMYSAFSVPLQLALGLGMAVLLFQNIRLKAFFRMVYFLPYIMPTVATAAIFSLLFSHRPRSPANQLLTFLGLDTQNWLLEPRGVFQIIFGPGVPEWLAGPGLALVVIIIFNVWVYTGYSIVIFLAGLGNIPTELYEAARIDGASGWQSFRHITLPLLSPTTFFLILIATIGTFQAFTQIWLMRRPGAFAAVDTINIHIFETIRATNPNYAYGAAMTFVLFAVILILTLIQNRVIGRRVFYG
jgi:multiple sugar transport system permease protein